MKTWIAAVAVAMQTVVLAGAGWAAPYTRVVSPAQGQCVPGPDVMIKFEAGGMTLGPSAWNLHFKLDEEPFQIQYDGNHAHVFKNVLPGTHTARVYAANAMQEAIPGTQSVVTFSVGYWDGANAPEQGQPLLTYNLPQGEYLGVDAGDITVDFLLENAALSPDGYQVAYYVDGRRFLVQDQCGPRHIKNLAPGHHRVRMELQDKFGDTVAGAFNSTERVILVSPDSVVKSPASVSDGYDGLPRLDSVKGSMTMGQAWSATEPVQPLTEADLEKQESLTVHTAEGTVGIHGGPPAETGVPVAVHEKEIGTAGQSAGTFTMTTKPTVGDYNVRQGGEPEAGTVDLNTAVPATAPSPNARSGSILVHSQGPEVGTKEEIVTPEKTENEAEAETSPTPRPAVRTRADGTQSVVKQTTASAHQSTATLKLEDRPGMRKVEPKTTSTVHVQDAGTTYAKARIQRGDRKTTAPPAPKLD